MKHKLLWPKRAEAGGLLLKAGDTIDLAKLYDAEQIAELEQQGQYQPVADEPKKVKANG